MNKLFAHWLARDPDPRSRDELQRLIAAGDEPELARRFATRLEFGTAGLRGVVGAGPAMMNRLVIRETSAGLGAYLLREVAGAAQRGIIVAYDARPDSRAFAGDAACVFAALGFTVYLTDTVTPTPVAAFGVVQLNAAAAVVVTASHNPPQYNGYKVYWGNGAQIIPPHDAGIATAIETAAREDVPWLEMDDARAAGRIQSLGADFVRRYIQTLQDTPLFAGDGGKPSIGIAYTAMHGVGAEIAERLLAEAGFDQVYSVAQQREPDGSFPTVKFPNPEEPGAMDAVLALAGEHQATLACANDPDADRLAVAVRTTAGDYQQLTGDMLGILLADYLLRQAHAFVPIVCTTIVSSSMLQRIAVAAGADYYQTLTGFKWLSNVALDHEDDKHQFLFAYEEAIGYACGRQVRDKDGLSALLAFARLTQALANSRKTVLDQLESLYRQHGLFLTGQRSIALQAGAPSVGELLRGNPPADIAGSRVMQTEDLSTGLRLYADGRTENLEFPPSDVLIYRLENQARVIVRPSGTEPKLKCYYEVVEHIHADTEFSTAMQKAQAALDELAAAHQQAIAALLDKAT